MKLTEAKENIIEFIKPCMNKTLHEGCLYRFQDDEIESMTKDEALNSSAFLESQEAGDTEIIGHYDITALLTFLRLKGNFVHFTLKGNIWEIVLNISFFKEHIIIKIPSKPLHLYTEKEDKDLLEGLKELGK